MVIDYSKIELDPKKPELLFIQLAKGLKLLFWETKNSCGNLPSALALANDLGINRVTVKKAYELLESEGIIERRSQKLFKVVTRKMVVNPQPFPNIGIISPIRFSEMVDQPDGIALQYIKGIMDAATEKQLSIVILQLPSNTATPMEIAKYNEILQNRLLGVIHLGGRELFPDHPLEGIMKNSSLPQVMISGYPEYDNIGAVIFDTHPGVCALVEQIKAMHHIKAGILLHMPTFAPRHSDSYYTYVANSRPGYIRDILLEYGLSCNDENCGFNCVSANSTFKVIKNLYNKNLLPTVFCCYNDTIARWALSALNELGLKVPEDISVTGFDGISIPGSSDILTTVGLPFYAIGRRVVQALLDYRNQGINDHNRLISFQTFLIMKDTLSYAKR